MYPFGDARNKGGAGGALLPDPVVAATATPDGGGYWLVTSSGQVMAFGDAKSYGSITTPLRAHAVGIVATSDGRGYWIACSTGGVFNFGDAPPHGSAKAGTPGLPIVAMAATPDGGGYWLADANGTVFAFGDAPRLHPVAAASPVAGLAVTPMGTGAFLAEQNGTVLGLGTAASDGSLSDVPATSPVVSIAEVVVPPPDNLSYDLAEANGKVQALGARQTTVPPSALRSSRPLSP